MNVKQLFMDGTMDIKQLFTDATMHVVVESMLKKSARGGMRLKSKGRKLKPVTSWDQVYERKAQDAENHSTRYPAMQLHPQITKEHKAFWSK